MTMWSAQVNDLIGGWIVTDRAIPMSQHDFNKEGFDPSKRGYVIAECMTETDARLIANLLNGAGYQRPIP